MARTHLIANALVGTRPASWLEWAVVVIVLLVFLYLIGLGLDALSQWQDRRLDARLAAARHEQAVARARLEQTLYLAKGGR